MCTTCGCTDNAHAVVTDMENGNTVRIEDPTHDHHQHHPDGPHPNLSPTHNHTHDRSHRHNHSHAHAHDHDHDHDDDHRHSHSHAHTHAHVHGTTISLEQDILTKNNQLAERNRGWFEGRNILALNLVSSPGAGKTTILERTIRDLAGELPIHVIGGDQETTRDAERIRSTGCKVIQINTGTGCHLDALMVSRGLKALQPPLDSVVMIENVGNLVCPALFDLGEYCKVAILSVTEGEDKPIKYPHMFRASRLMLLNKVDLLPHVAFDVERCIDYARRVNPEIAVMQMSASTGEGMNTWYQWLKDAVQPGTVSARSES